MLESLNFCRSSESPRINSFGMGSLGNRKICLLGFVATLIFALLVITIPSLLYSSEKDTEKSHDAAPVVEKPQKRFSSRIAKGKVFSKQILLDETRILKFLADPKARHLILDGRKKLQDLALNIYPEVQRFGESHSAYPEVQQYVEKFKIFCHPFPYEEIFVPFLCLGIADTSGINDPAIVKAIQTFQVRIFKYWLGLYQIGEQDHQLFRDLLAFCKTSSLDLFAKLIGPLLESFSRKLDEEDIDCYGEVICYFIGAEWADYEEERTQNVEYPLEVRAQLEKIQQDVSQQLQQHFAEIESKKSPGEKIVEGFKAELETKYPSYNQIHNDVIRDCFSRDAIIALFLEITASK